MAASFIQLDFIVIIYIKYNKFTFLSYFDRDRKYPNSRLVVDDDYEPRLWLPF